MVYLTKESIDLTSELNSSVEIETIRSQILGLYNFE